jgi:hypothetical protein
MAWCLVKHMDTESNKIKQVQFQLVVLHLLNPTHTKKDCSCQSCHFHVFPECTDMDMEKTVEVDTNTTGELSHYHKNQPHRKADVFTIQ